MAEGFGQLGLAQRGGRGRDRQGVQDRVHQSLLRTHTPEKPERFMESVLHAPVHTTYQKQETTSKNPVSHVKSRATHYTSYQLLN